MKLIEYNGEMLEVFRDTDHTDDQRFQIEYIKDPGSPNGKRLYSVQGAEIINDPTSNHYGFTWTQGYTDISPA